MEARYGDLGDQLRALIETGSYASVIDLLSAEKMPMVARGLDSPEAGFFLSLHDPSV
jgi:hypothetical protein